MQATVSAYLVLKNIPSPEWSFDISERPCVLGRSRHADIPIPQRFGTVSRRHAELWIDRCGVWLRDLGSKLGTNVNGVWVDHVPQVQLVVGDRVWFGALEADVVSEVQHLAHYDGDCDDDSLLTLLPVRRRSMGRDVAHQLSPAEIDIVLWVSRGYQADCELGRFLHRSPHTIRTEVRNIFHKLNLHSRAEVMCWLRHCCPL